MKSTTLQGARAGVPAAGAGRGARLRGGALGPGVVCAPKAHLGPPAAAGARVPPRRHRPKGQLRIAQHLVHYTAFMMVGQVDPLARGALQAVVLLHSVLAGAPSRAAESTALWQRGRLERCHLR